MNEDQQRLAKSFTSQKQLYEFVKQDMLNFGKIDTSLPFTEVGALYKAREGLKKEIEQKFKAYELLD